MRRQASIEQCVFTAGTCLSVCFVAVVLQGCRAEESKSVLPGSSWAASSEKTSVRDSDLKPAKVDAIPADSNPGNTLYVSPSGTGQVCSRDKPCDLIQARNSLRQKVANMTTDITVYLRGGLYELTSPFVLEPEDSGRNGKFVVYSAFPGEVPIISGGRSVKGWALHDANSGIYKATVSEDTDARQLYVNSVRAVRAKSDVNSGAYESLDNGWRTDNAGMASWRNISSIEVGSRVHWKSFRCPVQSIANGWRNVVANSSGSAFNFSGDWLANAGQRTKYHVGDFNGDAKSDLLFAYQDAGGWHNKVALSSGSAFSFSGDWLANAGQGTQYHVGDFNGDAKSDLLFAYQDAGGWHNKVALSSGSSFSFAGDWLANAGQGAKYYVGDFNGDAKSDLLFAYQDAVGWHNTVALSSGSAFSFAGDWLANAGQGAKYHVGDFNGDRKSDLLFAYEDASGWHNKVALSSGNAFRFSGDWLANAGQGAKYHVGDFNGDRKSDLLFAYEDASGWHNKVALSSGNAFSFSGDWLANGGQGTQYHLGDFSGDRKADLLFAFSDARISIQDPCWTNANRQQGFAMRQNISWIENAYELLNDPGEWYLDKPARTIYYRPRAGEDMATAAVVIPRLEALIDGRGQLTAAGAPTFLENIKFIGLVFSYAGWLAPNSPNGYAELQAGMHAVNGGELVRIAGGVTFSTARNVHFVRNRFFHLGGSGLNFEGGSQNLTILGNAFVDISGSGLQIGSVYDPAETRVERQHRDFVIKNNYVANTGVEYESAPGMFLGYVANAVLEHNEVFSLPYTGISVGWGWGTPSYAKSNKIVRNYVHRVMQRLSDGGGIYTLSAQPDSGLTENFIDDVGISGCTPPGHYNAIYHDEGSKFFVDKGNVVRNSCGTWLSLWTDSVQNNTLTGNHIDFDRVYCLRGLGTSERCAFGNNNVSGNIFSGGNWSAAAKAVMGAAGIEAEFKDILQTLF